VKLAFVVQRYGADIAGGSEGHCRELAQRLSGQHDITVLTTCARDYVTWKNVLPPGESRDGAVRVVRFPVRRPRRLKVFADISDEVFDAHAEASRQQEWFRENGPDTPALLDHLRRCGRGYDLVLFWTFRYAPSYFGVPIVAERAVLVPTAEEDSAVLLPVLQEFFRTPAGYLFLTPEEEALVTARAGAPLQPAATIGAGLDAVSPSTPETLGKQQALLQQQGIAPEFVLYLGRVDRNKGCDTLLEYFQQYAAAADVPQTTLVLAGPAKMQVPSHPRIKALGYVSDSMRAALLAHARALIIPSRYESLSIVLLEGWNHAVPALVNARCRVLKGQVERADGGLYYRSAREFSAALAYLLSHPAERDAFGRQGLRYVEQEYRWPTVLARVEQLLNDVNRAH
jgi:glycosyltransferase involved in cell wall biosynthesis